MATLKEIKERIGSVKSTLKITTAMKMVASAKLHKAQAAIEGMLPYEQSLQRTLDELLKAVRPGGEWSSDRPVRRVTLVCLASNSSLCGSFNANVIREAASRIAALKRDGVEEITVHSIGRKMAEAMRKAGYPSPADYTELSAKPSYEAAAELSDLLVKDYLEGRTDRVELIYNHFVSTAVHRPTCETYLPLSLAPVTEGESYDEFIIEPDKEELLPSCSPRPSNSGSTRSCWILPPPSTPPGPWRCRRPPTMRRTSFRSFPSSTTRAARPRLPPKFSTL